MIVIYKVLLYTLFNLKIITIQCDRMSAFVTAPAFIFLFLLPGLNTFPVPTYRSRLSLVPEPTSSGGK